MTLDKRIIFCGTSKFAQMIIEYFFNNQIPIHTIITQPDKPQGRKKILTPPPAKEAAEKFSISIMQPEDINSSESVKQIKNLNPDIMIVAAYGQFISQEVIDLPKLPVINVHPSLLPKYRGASPLQAAIKNQDKESGVTLIQMDEKMDHGPVITQDTMDIAPDETFESLEVKTAELSAQMLINLLPDYLEGKTKPLSQDHESATFTKTLQKNDGKIKWEQKADQIEAQIRAYSTWPKSFSSFQKNGKSINFLISEASVSEKDISNNPGMFIDLDGRLGIETHDKILIIETMQVAGKKPISGNDFIKGYQDVIGSLAV